MTDIKINAKYCGKCDKVKSVDDFYNCQGRNHWNLSSNCKTCMNATFKKYRERKKLASKEQKEISTNNL